MSADIDNKKTLLLPLVGDMVTFTAPDGYPFTGQVISSYPFVAMVQDLFTLNVAAIELDTQWVEVTL